MVDTFRSKNKTINALLAARRINQEEYICLFENKSEYSDEDINVFNILLQKVIDMQHEREALNLTYLVFPKFFFSDFIFKESQPIGFLNAEFTNDTDFKSCKFTNEVNFTNVTFYGEVSFKNITFLGEANFCETKFIKKCSFTNAKFINEAYFINTKFFREVNFINAKSKEDMDFTAAHSYNLNLKNTHFTRVSYIDMKGLDENNSIIQLSTKNIANKETARLIKDDFESKRNITESNKYFAIEQELYLDEMKQEGWKKNIGDIFAIGLHGFISNFGTSWIKVLISIFIFILLVFLGYEYLHDFVIIKEGFYVSINKAIELIDPLKMFKGDDKTFENHNALGFVIRIFTIYLFYQFITAFRNNTRRK